MLTFNQLKLNTPKDVRQRSKKTNVTITGAQEVKRTDKEGIKKHGIKFQATGRAHTEKVYYNIEIELYPERIANKPTDIPKYDPKTNTGIMRVEHPHDNMDCWVHCTCPFFTFHFEWLLTQYGSSELRQSDDSPCDITNPKYYTGVCKHLYKAFPLALKALKHIAVG